MTYSVENNEENLDIQSVVEQLKRFLRPNQELILMLVTEQESDAEFEVVTTMEESSEVQSAMRCYAELLEGDDEGVEELGCQMEDPVTTRRILQ